MATADGNLFSKTTQCIFYNYKPKPAQRMLDFDFLCGQWGPHDAVAETAASPWFDLMLPHPHHPQGEA